MVYLWNHNEYPVRRGRAPYDLRGAPREEMLAPMMAKAPKIIPHKYGHYNNIQQRKVFTCIHITHPPTYVLAQLYMYIYVCMYMLKHCHRCYMKNMAWKRVSKWHIQHQLKPTAIFHLKATPYSMNLGNVLTCNCIDNIFRWHASIL